MTRNHEQIIRVHRQTADIYRRTGRMSEALGALERAQTVAATLAEAHPENRDYQDDLERACTDIGDLSGAVGRLSESLRAFDQAVTIGRKLIEASPSTASYRSSLARTLRLRGIAMHRCGRPANAGSDFRQSIAILKNRTEPVSWDIYDLACCHSLLSGLAAEAGSGLTADDGRYEADHAIATLRRAIAAGWRDAAFARADTDLDPIRSRPDFQMLVADMEFPDEPFAPSHAMAGRASRAQSRPER